MGLTIDHRKARSATCRSQRPHSSEINCSNITPRVSTEVLLHEMAHHLTAAGAPHGAEFVATMTELAGSVMGPEARHVLRVIYSKEGVAG